MTTGLTVSLTGFAQLEQRLLALGADVATKTGQAAVRAGAAVIAKQVKAYAPVGPTAEGAVQNRRRKSGNVVQEAHHKIVKSIKVTRVRSAVAGQVLNSITAGKAYHALFVEQGSIHNTPAPFMLLALTNATQDAINAIGTALDARLTRLGV